ncbi:hypothetical protein [Jiangella alkaliphila]|uniref:Uncharacterized protein n=1 Tax=Jiangella alkaliphila TaxID=419479 RepID=A0A1H2IBP1_9ACTN|nr:hypothetical protein [Jiangella alkaliphila]SDU41356.1 hypothetical protein SAMN04488563_1577 [Jiangella alkaliphila]
MRARALAGGAVAALLLSGCGGGERDEPTGLAASTDAGQTADQTGDQGGTPEPDDGAGESGTTTGEPDDESGEAANQGEDWTLDIGGQPPEAPADLAVYEAYLEYWRADLEALAIPDPAYQPFLDLVVDPQRQRVVESLERMAADGVRTIGTMSIEPLVVSVSGPIAAIQDCLDARETYDVDDSGAEVPDGRGGQAAVVVQLAQQGGAWLVSDVQESDHDCA